MVRPRLLLGAALAAALGGGVGWVTRSKPAQRESRPKAVSDVLRALESADRGDATSLVSALAVAGDPSSYDAPWRDEVELGRLAAKGDLDALWRFADDARSSAPGARALLWIAARARDEAERERARDRLRSRFPDSWLHAASSREGGR